MTNVAKIPRLSATSSPTVISLCPSRIERNFRDDNSVDFDNANGILFSSFQQKNRSRPSLNILLNEHDAHGA